jgi:putative addiction module killer protein
LFLARQDHFYDMALHDRAARQGDVQAGAKVATALERIAAGNLSNVKTAGNGVLEYRVDFGPGYRIYFGRDGDRLVILLAGGTKKPSRKTSAKQRRIGKTTVTARLRKEHDATDQRFS